MDEYNVIFDGMLLLLVWQKVLVDVCIEWQLMGVLWVDVVCVLWLGCFDVFVKLELIDVFSELGDEIVCLCWLQVQGQLVLMVIVMVEEVGWCWLLMSVLFGCDLVLLLEFVLQ